MTKKIGRNEPCPCGSGKKYKYCCMRTEQAQANNSARNHSPLQYSGLDAPKILSYSKTHNVGPILDYLISLQLNPANHGKNLRFDHIEQLVVFSMGKGTAKPDIQTFKCLIDEEYPYDMMEDIPINMFCERVVFFGGNYWFFPGISTHCAELFRMMTESIYYHKPDLPKAFKIEACQGISLLLELGNTFAIRSGIKAMLRGNDNPRENIVDNTSPLNYALPNAMMKELIRYNRLDESILDNFLLSNENPQILTNNPERIPILYKPLLEYDGHFYFIGITNQGCAINNFILKTAIKHNCINEVVKLTQSTIWNRIVHYCMNLMHWIPIEFDGFSNEDGHYNECLFHIDTNWVAYLCYAKDTSSDVPIDGAECPCHWNVSERLRNTLKAIRSNEQTKEFHIFTLVLYSSMGELYALQIGDQTGTDYLEYLSAFDFLQLVQTEKWDNMSLVRYARTKAKTKALKQWGNQSLDCYFLYKSKGESFYISDESKSDVLQIEPNSGCELIFESKELLNFHAIPMHIDDKRLGYIPVQRDIDYKSIYRPLDKSINARCCESYSIPIWVKCLQAEIEGDNPSSIIETVITAIAFWMDRLQPAIEEWINKCDLRSLEIELIFDNEILSDKYIHNEELQYTKNGLITFSKTETGVKVHLNKDFYLNFLGSDNANERLMMKNILSEMLGIAEERIQDIIDEFMPLGQTKMILMTEASNGPLSYPLWLYPPIFIHEASRQLLFDLFPQWMNDKGVDFIGKLTDVAQKEKFLHDGVDVLFEQLDCLIRVFDSNILLKRLISNHETLIFQREQNKMLHPAQILCFGDNAKKREEFFENERQLTEAALATRALIEYLSAIQGTTGQEKAGTDDIEYMLSIMSEIIHIGGICDAIHMKVSDHIIEKLNSGRYGIYDYDFNDSVSGFASARSIESVNTQVEHFGSKMEHMGNLKSENNDVADLEFEEIDDAFLSDWGVSYRTIMQVLYACYLLAMKYKRSVIELPQDEFVDGIIGLCPGLEVEDIEKAMEHIALKKRADYLTPPDGMDGKEIFPWIYNRELSYLRRPIIKWHTHDGINIVFGFRSCIMAGLQLTDLLYTGRLKNVGRKLSKLLGKFESAKGAAFNEDVRKWLKEHTSLKIWEYEVTIKPKGVFIAQSDLGDIDVLAYDTETNVVYSIECKNTNTAKNVREMKKEMDDYLGRDGKSKKALISKHMRRHVWLLNNIDKVRTFVEAKTNPTVKSVMLTSEVIPTSYLRRKEIPLPILNFHDLKRKGIKYLEESE